MDTPLAVQARGITKCFGDVVALDGSSIWTWQQGDIDGLVEPNGAGKMMLLGSAWAVAELGHLEILGTPPAQARSPPPMASPGFGGRTRPADLAHRRRRLAALAAL